MAAEPINSVENAHNIAKFLDACQNNPKLAQEKIELVLKSIRCKILCMCSLSEKLQLLEIKKELEDKKDNKSPDLFKKLLAALIGNSTDILKRLNIEPKKVKAIAENMNLPTKKSVKSQDNQNAQKIQAEKLTNNLLTMAKEKLINSISKIMQFLNPTATKSVDESAIKSILTRTLSTFTNSELNTFEQIISSKAVAKILNNSDIIIDTVITILKKDI
jgi:hypothetical protein